MEVQAADKPLPCLGIAFKDLLSLFEQHEISIGSDLEGLLLPESDDRKAEADSVAETNELEENEA